MASRQPVLVTGGAGYIGSHVVATLRRPTIRWWRTTTFPTGYAGRCATPS